MSSCRVHVCVSYGVQLCVCEPLCLNAGLLQDAEFIERNLDVLLELMISSLPCQFPSKRYRLEYLHHLIVYILKVGKTKTSLQILDECAYVSGRAVTK